MKTTDTNRERTSISEEPSQVYEKPCVEAEETFETFVLACALMDGQNTDCNNSAYEFD